MRKENVVLRIGDQEEVVSSDRVVEAPSPLEALRNEYVSQTESREVPAVLPRNMSSGDTRTDLLTQEDSTEPITENQSRIVLSKSRPRSDGSHKLHSRDKEEAAPLRAGSRHKVAGKPQPGPATAVIPPLNRKKAHIESPQRAKHPRESVKEVQITRSRTRVVQEFESK